MAKVVKKKGSGGARPGAGRKKIDPTLKVENNTQIVSFRVKHEQVEPVKKIVNDYLNKK